MYLFLIRIISVFKRLNLIIKIFNVKVYILIK